MILNFGAENDFKASCRHSNLRSRSLEEEEKEI